MSSATSPRRVLMAAFGRAQQAMPGNPLSLLEPTRRPANVARMLALAHHIQRAIDRRRVPDQAAVAAHLGLTRARISQLLDLLMLAPDIQAAVVEIEALDGVEPMSERRLREVASLPAWNEQRLKFDELKRQGPNRRRKATS